MTMKRKMMKRKKIGEILKFYCLKKKKKSHMKNLMN